MSVLLSTVLAAAPSWVLPLPAFALTAADTEGLAPTEQAQPEHAEPEQAQPEPVESDDKAQRSRRTRGLVLRGYAKTGTAGLPGVGFGGGVSVGWLRKRFRLDAMGSGRLNRTSWYPGDEVGSDFSLWRAGLRGCLVLGADRVATPICLGGDGGMVSATGFGIRTPKTERQPWGSVFADIDLGWHVLPTMAIVTTSRWLVPLVRRQYYIGDRGTLVTTPSFGVEIGLGLELVLP